MSQATALGGVVNCGDEGTFKDNTYITKVVLPSSVTEIENGAFANCTELTTVSGLQNVKTFGSDVFNGCSKLKSAKLSKAASIGNNLFNGCASLKSVSLCSKLTSIPSNSFNGCSKLGNVKLPSRLTTIGEYAFKDCDAMTAVTIPGKVTEIGSHAFESCDSLKKMVIGNGVTAIGDNAFANENKLASVKIGKSVKSINGSAFYGNPMLKSISIPASVRTLGNYAFAECASLQTVSLKKGLIEIGEGTFSGDIKLKKLVIPTTVTKMGWHCVNNCTSLKLCRIPYSVTEIGGLEQMDGAEYQVYKDSYAKTYLDEHEITYTLLTAVPAKSFKATKNTIYITTGDMKKIGYSLSPSNTSDAIKWESSYTDVATVNELGEVTAHKKGTATILATSTSGKTIRVKIVVANAPNEISFAKASKAIYVGKSYTQKATVKDEDGVRKDIVPNYSSSNLSVATVNKTTGKVTAKEPGTATIVARTGNLTAKYKVTVVRKMATPKVSSSGKTLIVRTVAGANVTVQANKDVLGASYKKVKADKRGVAKIQFKKPVRGISVKVTVKKSGYSTGKKTVKF